MFNPCPLRQLIPVNGRKVVFTIVPAGSYAVPGEVYAVSERYDSDRKSDVRLTRVFGGTGATIDRPAAYRGVVWHYAD